MDKNTLIIDIRNALYRAAYAYLVSPNQRPNNHPFIVLLRQMHSWNNAIRPGRIIVAWDAPRKTVWRRKILPTYKDRDNNDYIADMSETLEELTTICNEFFRYMNIYQLSMKRMEADDLIYASVDTLHPENSIIVSTDSDMIQIPYKFSSASVFDPTKMDCVPVPTVNPVMLKALTGDKSDKIDGYRGIGPKRGVKLLEGHSALQEYTTTQGRDLFIRNLLLIDLSLNPHLLSNKLHVCKVLSKPIEFNKGELYTLISKYKIAGLMSEFDDLISPFAKIGK